MPDQNSPHRIDPDQQRTLLFPASDSIEAAHDDGSGDEMKWDATYPARKLWVHPGLAYDATPFTDEDALDTAAESCPLESREGELAFECPHSGCAHEFGVLQPFCYTDLKAADGIIRCHECDEPVFAHKHPPDDYTPPQRQQNPGRLRGGRP